VKRLSQIGMTPNCIVLSVDVRLAGGARAA